MCLIFDIDFSALSSVVFWNCRWRQVLAPPLFISWCTQHAVALWSLLFRMWKQTQGADLFSCVVTKPVGATFMMARGCLTVYFRHHRTTHFFLLNVIPSIKFYLNSFPFALVFTAQVTFGN